MSRKECIVVDKKLVWVSRFDKDGDLFVTREYEDGKTEFYKNGEILRYHIDIDFDKPEMDFDCSEQPSISFRDGRKIWNVIVNESKWCSIWFKDNGNQILNFLKWNDEVYKYWEKTENGEIHEYRYFNVEFGGSWCSSGYELRKIYYPDGTSKEVPSESYKESKNWIKRIFGYVDRI
jgi:hypothetical protein